MDPVTLTIDLPLTFSDQDVKWCDFDLVPILLIGFLSVRWGLCPSWVWYKDTWRMAADEDICSDI